METCFTYTSETMYVSSDERKIINRIHKFKKNFPDQVVITREPETNDGCICAKLPASWLEIRPKVKKELTPERLLSLRKQAEAMRKRKATCL